MYRGQTLHARGRYRGQTLQVRGMYRGQTDITCERKVQGTGDRGKEAVCKVDIRHSITQFAEQLTRTFEVLVTKSQISDFELIFVHCSFISSYFSSLIFPGKSLQYKS